MCGISEPTEGNTPRTSKKRHSCANQTTLDDLVDDLRVTDSGKHFIDHKILGEGRLPLTVHANICNDTTAVHNEDAACVDAASAKAPSNQ